MEERLFLLFGTLNAILYSEFKGFYTSKKQKYRKKKQKEMFYTKVNRNALSHHPSFINHKTNTTTTNNILNYFYPRQYVFATDQ